MVYSILRLLNKVGAREETRTWKNRSILEFVYRMKGDIVYNCGEVNESMIQGRIKDGCSLCGSDRRES
jgi:hypothetical protein